MAARRALQRSANLEAVQHLTRGLALLAMLPETQARAQQELDLQLALAPVLMATKGFASPEVEQAYTRAMALCRQVGQSPQRFPALRGVWAFYHTRNQLDTARELAEQLLQLAQTLQHRGFLLEAHRAMGETLSRPGEWAAARAHFEAAMALYDP